MEIIAERKAEFESQKTKCKIENLKTELKRMAWFNITWRRNDSMKQSNQKQKPCGYSELRN